MKSENITNYHILEMYLEEFGFQTKRVGKVIHLLSPNRKLILDLYKLFSGNLNIKINFYGESNEDRCEVLVKGSELNLAIHKLKYR